MTDLDEMTLAETYSLSMVREYVSGWGTAQAIRELIQNALDSDSPFMYEFVSDIDGKWVLKLSSRRTVLDSKTLLLGVTTKAGDNEAIGSFGEGYKIALLVLTREGHDVQVLNGPHMWQPVFRYDAKFDADILCIDEYREPGETDARGLTFVVHNLSTKQKDEVIESCLMMQKNVGAMTSTPYGEILHERKGKLYVGYLYVCETKMNYGYNIKPEHIQLERDRQTVDSWSMKRITLDMWIATKQWARIAKMMQDDVSDVDYAEYGSFPKELSDECFKLFRQGYPNAVVVYSEGERKRYIDRGYSSAVVVGGSFYSGVHSSPMYQSSIPAKSMPKPKLELEKWFGQNRQYMRRPAIIAFKELMKKAQHWENE